MLQNNVPAIRLHECPAASSFGVYQEVTVEPGKTYRADMYWKGEKLGTKNWWEVIVLDGPWDPVQADSGDPVTQVQPNYMYAYDDDAYGLPGGIGATFGWIWGHEQYAPPKDQVDSNNRKSTADGDRTLTREIFLETVRKRTGVSVHMSKTIGGARRLTISPDHSASKTRPRLCVSAIWTASRPRLRAEPTEIVA